MFIRKGLILAAVGTTVVASSVVGARHASADTSSSDATGCTVVETVLPADSCTFGSTLYTTGAAPQTVIASYSQAKVDFTGLGVVAVTSPCGGGLPPSPAGSYVVQLQPFCDYTVSLANGGGIASGRDIS